MVPDLVLVRSVVLLRFYIGPRGAYVLRRLLRLLRVRGKEKPFGGVVLGLPVMANALLPDELDFGVVGASRRVVAGCALVGQSVLAQRHIVLERSALILRGPVVERLIHGREVELVVRVFGDAIVAGRNLGVFGSMPLLNGNRGNL